MEAKRTPAGRGGRGEGNNVRDIRQYKMKDGSFTEGTEGQWRVAGRATEGMETGLEGPRAEGTMTEREETEAEMGTEMEGSESREAKDSEERDSGGVAANTSSEGTAIVQTVPEWG